MKYFQITLGIFFALAASRFIPHPPNFTSLLALSFYVPAFFGYRFIPALIICFALTDLVIGFHNTIIFTWGSIIFIGIIANYLNSSLIKRLSGALIGAVIFFLITNFGIWSFGQYGYSINGLITCYTLALPFFGYSLVSTFIFSGLIEIVYKSFNLEKYFSIKKF